VCADATNTKCHRYIGRETNALIVHWPYGAKCWMNPPFGGLYHWMKKAYMASQEDACVVVCFAPSWTQERWYHEFCSRAATIIFLRDEVHFLNADGSVPSGGFPHGMMIVVFRPGVRVPSFEFAHHAMRD
jgi:hypothetical protein